MAVEVIRGFDGAGRELLDEYEQGASIEVDTNGHLLVRLARPANASATSRGRVIAMYAPGKWGFTRVADTPSK